MAEETRVPGGAPGLGLLVVTVAAGVGGVFLLREPLQSSRPKEAASLPWSTPIYETVDARLWQDPLQVIQSDWDRLVAYTIEQESLPPSTVAPQTIKQMREQMRDPVALQPQEMLVIGALVNGGPYANDAEERRRTRFALVSALADSDYVPEAPERIGYFLSPQYSQASGLSTQTRAMEQACNAVSNAATRCPLLDAVTLVAFERFNPRPNNSTDTRWKRVLVLWLNSRDFANNPVPNIRWLLDEIVPDNKGSGDNVTSVALIGPSDSNSLSEMIGGPSDESPDRFREQVRCFPDDSRRLLLMMVSPEEDIKRSPSCIADDPSEAPKVNIQYEPSPIEAQFLPPTPDPVDTTIYTIRDYLDYGLPFDAELNLRACLNDNQRLENCLRHTMFDQILDSNPEWKDTIVDILTPYSNTRYPRNPSDTINRVAQGETWIQSLLLDVHYYLDYGLPEPEESEMSDFRSCLVTARQSLGIRSNLSECLRTYLSFEDSDPFWYTTVVGDWMGRNPHFIQSGANANNAQTSESIQSSEGEPATIRISMFSSRSTVPLNLLSPGLGPNHSFPEDSLAADQALRNKLAISDYRSVLARDDAVLHAVVKELIARGLDVSCEPTLPIAIISEIDSYYGLSMQSIVENAISTELKCGDGDNPTVHSFGYLRGVDGEVPQAYGANPGSNQASEGGQEEPLQSAGWLFPAFEPPVGPAQVDYVRRLAENISQHSESHGDGTRLQAIGVFGADIYDKQLILQALRERLPNVTVFTTDLDARFTDPNEYRWNRNLIVGSAYALSPQTPDFEVSPFRDSYQTAFFRAVQMALDIDPGRPVVEYRPPYPRLFEIGRSGAIDITICDQSSDLPCEDKANNAVDPYLRTLRIVTLLLPLLSLLLVSRLRSRQLAARSKSLAHSSNVVVSRLAAFATVAVGVLLWNWSDWSPEPLLLFQGISVVPTLALHLSVIIYAFAIVILGVGRIAQGNRDIADKFSLDHSARDFSARSVLEMLLQLLRQPSAILLSNWTVGPAKSLDLQDIWDRYHQRGDWNTRFARALTWAVILTMAIMTIFALDGDAGPLLVTQEVGFWIDVIRVLSLFFTLIAVFLCTDALLLSRVFIREITESAIDGSNTLQEPDTQETNVKTDDKVERHWRAMKLIRIHTEWVSPLIVLPFILVFLLLLARSTLFDAWAWDLTLVSVYAGVSAYLLISGLLFQLTASRNREDILQDLSLYRRTLTNDIPKLKETEIVLEQIRSIHSGAFVPWTRHPILQSIALPSTGVGLLALLDTILR